MPMFHGNRRPLRARRLRPWVAFLGIALAAAITFVAFQPEEVESGAEEQTWLESHEEIVAIHHLDRYFRVDAGLEPDWAGDGLWARYLRWSWREGFSRTTVEESTASLLRELDHRVGLSPRGLAACAVAASMIGDHELAGGFSTRLSAHESGDARSYEGWIQSWLDGERTDEEARAALHDWARSILLFDTNPHWWEAKVVLDLAGPEDSSDIIRRLREKESILVREWTWRHACSQSIGLLVLLAAFVALLFLFRHKPAIRRVPGFSPVVRGWGILQMFGWFGWLTVAGYGFSGLLDSLFAEGGPDENWRFVFWQLFQLAGAVWIWRLAGSPGWRLLGLRPLGEIRPSRWFVPVFGFTGLIIAYYLSMGYVRGDGAILDALLDTTEAAQLGFIRWPWRDIFFSVLTGVVLAPIMEEIIHRGVIYQALRARTGRWPAIFLSSAVFAILHFYSWWGILDVFVMGVFFAWIYDRTRSLWPGIIFHAFGNALITIDQWLLWGPR